VSEATVVELTLRGVIEALKSGCIEVQRPRADLILKASTVLGRFVDTGRV
jgi:hypothetical protein